jgi:hypothetical protein
MGIAPVEIAIVALVAAVMLGVIGSVVAAAATVLRSRKRSDPPKPS